MGEKTDCFPITPHESRFTIREGNIFEKVGFTRFGGLIVRIWFSNFAAALFRDHHEQQSNDLRHQIVTMGHDLFAKHKPSLKIPVPAFPSRSQRILVKAGTVFSRPSRKSFGDIRTNRSNRPIELNR